MEDARSVQEQIGSGLATRHILGAEDEAAEAFEQARLRQREADALVRAARRDLNMATGKGLDGVDAPVE